MATAKSTSNPSKRMAVTAAIAATSTPRKTRRKTKATPDGIPASIAAGMRNAALARLAGKAGDVAKALKGDRTIATMEQVDCLVACEKEGKDRTTVLRALAAVRADIEADDAALDAADAVDKAADKADKAPKADGKGKGKANGVTAAVAAVKAAAPKAPSVAEVQALATAIDPQYQKNADINALVTAVLAMRQRRSGGGGGAAPKREGEIEIITLGCADWFTGRKGRIGVVMYSNANWQYSVESDDDGKTWKQTHRTHGSPVVPADERKLTKASRAALLEAANDKRKGRLALEAAWAVEA